MDEEIIQDVPEQKRTEFREQINNAIQNPTNDIKQMIAWVGNTELKVQSQVVINGFTVAIFLGAISRAIIFPKSSLDFFIIAHKISS